MRPIILWELNQRKVYLFWWTVSTLAVITLIMLIYPAIHQQERTLNQLMSQLPASISDLHTGGSLTSIAGPIGYLNSQLYYVTLPIILIIMSIGLGSSLLAREEQSHTIELILSRPISRSNLLLAKAISGLILVFIVSVIGFMATLSLAQLVNLHISALDLLLASTYATLFSLIFGAVAFLLTAASNLTRKSSLAVAIAIGFGGYVLASLGSISSYIEAPAQFLPYHYYDPAQILTGHVEVGLNIYILAVFIVTILLSWLGFRRRDIT